MNANQVRQQAADRKKRCEGKLDSLASAVLALLPEIKSTGKDGYGQAAREANAVCSDLGAAIDAVLRKKYFPTETPKAVLVKQASTAPGKPAVKTDVSKFNVGP